MVDMCLSDSAVPSYINNLLYTSLTYAVEALCYSSWQSGALSPRERDAQAFSGLIIDVNQKFRLQSAVLVTGLASSPHDMNYLQGGWTLSLL